MHARVAGLVVALGLAATSAGAQSSSPLADAVRARLKRYSTNIVAAAQEMPADKYGYKPTPAQMTFGAIVLHVAASNEILCSHLSGAAAPEEPKLDPATAGKDALVARVQRSFDYCQSHLANLTDTGLADTIPFFGNYKATRAAVMIEVPADLADHYGQMSGYLRLNGLLPPTARRSGM